MEEVLPEIQKTQCIKISFSIINKENKKKMYESIAFASKSFNNNLISGRKKTYF